jgi:hypothetical protein
MFGTPQKSNAALPIVAHGSTVNPDSSMPTLTREGSQLIRVPEINHVCVNSALVDRLLNLNVAGNVLAFTRLPSYATRL